MRRVSGLWDTVLIASVVAVVSVCAQLQQDVTAAEAELDGPIVQIGPGGDDQNLAELSDEPQTRVLEEVYWIGIRGRSIQSEVLRTHLQLAEDMGVVVEEVVPDSPAAKAGIQKHDIIIRANDDAVDNMSVLQNQVREFGEKPIELKIFRYCKQEKLVVVPELRPAEVAQSQRPGNDPWGRLQGNPQDLLNEMLRGNGRLGAMGPGIIMNGQPFGMNAMPNGLSVSVNRSNDGPPEITVKKGDQTWTIVGDDKEALAELPEDVRPFVERMLRGQGMGMGNFNMQGFDLNADLLEGLQGRFGNVGQEAEGRIANRIQELEKKLQALQKRLDAEPAVE